MAAIIGYAVRLIAGVEKEERFFSQRTRKEAEVFAARTGFAPFAPVCLRPLHSQEWLCHKAGLKTGTTQTRPASP